MTDELKLLKFPTEKAVNNRIKNAILMSKGNERAVIGQILSEVYTAIEASGGDTFYIKLHFQELQYVIGLHYEHNS